MRSRNAWPGSEVTRTLIQSDSTRVPPVTADRSPPDSRITGADSPVIADSSTDATPSMISPSAGMNSPAPTRTTSSFLSDVAGTSSYGVRFEPDPTDGPMSRFAMLSVRALRRVSACALPRPSAIASAKFANSTVSHSQKVIWISNPRPGRPAVMSRSNATVVSALPTSTTNTTGFLAMVRGCSLPITSRAAPRTMPGSQMDSCFACDIRTPARDSSADARRSVRGSAPGRTSARRR